MSSYTSDDDATDARHRNEWLSRLVEVTTAPFSLEPCKHRRASSSTLVEVDYASYVSAEEE